MRELTKSIGSFSWAMSLFGMRQMANVLRPSRATEAFEGVTEATQGELGDLLRSTFKLGDRMQRGLVDMTFGMFSLEMLDPRAWTRTMTEMTGGAAQAMTDVTGGAARAVAEAVPSATPVARERPGARRPPEESRSPRASAAAPADRGTAPGAGGGGDGWGPMGP